MKFLRALLFFILMLPALAQADSLQVWAAQLANVATMQGTSPFLTSTGTNDINIGTTGSGQYNLKSNNLTRWSILNDGTFYQDGTNGGNIVFNKNGLIVQGTADAADTKAVTISGGGAGNSSRGGYVDFFGNEFTSNGGFVGIHSGNGSSNSRIVLDTNGSAGTINLQTAGTDRVVMDVSGNLALTGGNISQTITSGSPQHTLTDGTITARWRVVNTDRAYFGTTSSTSLGIETGGTQKWNFGTTGDLQSDSTNGGNVILTVASKNYQLKGGGAAAKAGTFTCNGITGVVITTTSAGGNMAIAFSPNTISGTAGIAAPYVSSITPGTSFTVKCSIAGETSTYNWAMTTVN